MCDQLNSMLRVTPHVSMHRTDGHQRFNYLSGATRVMRPHTLRALFSSPLIVNRFVGPFRVTASVPMFG